MARPSRLALIALIASCGVQNVGGGIGIDLPYFDVVYECELAGETLEVCWDRDEAELEESVGGPCEPTSRHAGPCVYGCDPHAGCNALHSCWCP